ncbi:hypothetical protein [Polymorphobacter megasporae]|uniref:hypothetical protein n=1 Tax=Glacieibacterium megasporae TaxID=2835787 RepID=UPI001C1E880C|nr:hypothetical protein [Polymorphobacter megasporae]UAJ10742.1 hypothetical protein KTC28_03100 [Polymorphobacter megasporae]
MDRHPNILNAATNLLGVCFFILTGLRLTHSTAITYADEVAWVAALCLLCSTFLSYVVIRSERPRQWIERIAEATFFAGIGLLTVAVALLWQLY